MSSDKKKTISIPSNVGSTTLSDTFGKITLSNEVKDLLSALNAELSVRYIPGGDKPVIQVLKNGKNVCSLDEFKALSGYRRFVAEALTELDKTTSVEKKVKHIAFFIRRYTANGNVLSARILEQNMAKFNQLGSALQLFEKHKENIDSTIDDEWKTYILDVWARVVRVYLSIQMECMDAQVVPRERVEEAIFDIGVPKWIHTKFLDKNFTNNLKDCCKTLLFPKNNYLKSVAMTTTELKDESFMNKNKIILEKSGGIIALSRANYSSIIPSYSDAMAEAVEAYMAKYMWVLTAPNTAEEILDLRRTGKMPPVFRDIQPARASGQKGRPESDTARLTREIGNVLGKIQATWNGIMNFVVPVANPRTEFWQMLYPNAANWEITPTNTIYDCIEAEGNFAPLYGLRNCASRNVLILIGEIISQALMVPHGTDDNAKIVDLFTPMLNRADYGEFGIFTETRNNYVIADLEELEMNPPTPAEISVGASFLGIKESKARDKKKSGASAVRLTTSVLNELDPLKNHPIYEPVKIWLMTTFKTGERHALQKIAAERILGEALKHQDKIFSDDFIEEDELHEIEEFYEEED